jgi:hypothetical protein
MRAADGPAAPLGTFLRWCFPQGSLLRCRRIGVPRRSGRPCRAPARPLAAAVRRHAGQQTARRSLIARRGGVDADIVRLAGAGGGGADLHRPVAAPTSGRTPRAPARWTGDASRPAPRRSADRRWSRRGGRAAGLRRTGRGRHAGRRLGPYSGWSDRVHPARHRRRRGVRRWRSIRAWPAAASGRARSVLPRRRDRGCDRRPAVLRCAGGPHRPRPQAGRARGGGMRRRYLQLA